MNDTTRPLPSGEQWTVSLGDIEATVVEVGGGLRSLTCFGTPVLVGYEPTEVCSGGRGQILLPWPNRIADGTYTYDGQERQLDLTEPDRRNAMHGLVAWTRWQVRESSQSRLVVGCVLPPQPGWDWILDVETEYVVDESGLRVTPRVTNVGDAPAPFGYGAHPYLTAGEDRVDDATLLVPAASTLPADADRMLPALDAEPVPVGAELDFRTGRPIGDTKLDLVYTDLAAEEDGCWRVGLRHGKSETTLWADAHAFPWVQVFTGDSLPPSQARRTGVAVEPMTCPARAFETGRDLIELAPGGTWSGTWGITG